MVSKAMHNGYVNILYNVGVASYKNRLSLRRHLSGLNTFPASEKSLSTGAKDAGTDRNCTASVHNSGKFFWLGPSIGVGLYPRELWADSSRSLPELVTQVVQLLLWMT